MHAQPIHDCENAIQMSIWVMWLRLRMIDEPANILVRSLSEHEQLNFVPNLWTNQKFGFDQHASEFVHWSRANMDWTIDIYGDNHNWEGVGVRVKIGRLFKLSEICRSPAFYFVLPWKVVHEAYQGQNSPPSPNEVTPAWNTLVLHSAQ